MRVVVDIYPPDRRRRDMDNTWKTAGDALTKAGVWLDDFQIVDLRMRRMEPMKGGAMVVMVSENILRFRKRWPIVTPSTTHWRTT